MPSFLLPPFFCETLYIYYMSWWLTFSFPPASHVTGGIEGEVEGWETDWRDQRTVPSTAPVTLLRELQQGDVVGVGTLLSVSMRSVLSVIQILTLTGTSHGANIYQF